MIDSSDSGADTAMLVALFAACEARWDESVRHDRFLAACRDGGAWAFAAARYRGALDARAGDEVAIACLARVRAGAEVALAAGPARRHAAREGEGDGDGRRHAAREGEGDGRTHGRPRAVTIVVVLAVIVLAAVLVLRLGKARVRAAVDLDPGAVEPLPTIAPAR